MINIKGIKKSMLLSQLWRYSKSQGMSIFSLPIDPVNIEIFESIVKDRENGGHGLYFDYLMGKVIKCDISGDELDPWLYERDNGEGKAKLVVDFIRQENK